MLYMWAALRGAPGSLADTASTLSRHYLLGAAEPEVGIAVVRGFGSRAEARAYAAGAGWGGGRMHVVRGALAP